MIMRCYHCNKLVAINPSYKEYYLYLRELVDNTNKKMFCSDECYKEYLDKYFVEEYKENKIYKINKYGVNFYIPYAGCTYGFKTLEDCKTRNKVNSLSH